MPARFCSAAARPCARRAVAATPGASGPRQGSFRIVEQGAVIRATRSSWGMAASGGSQVPRKTALPCQGRAAARWRSSSSSTIPSRTRVSADRRGSLARARCNREVDAVIARVVHESFATAHRKVGHVPPCVVVLNHGRELPGSSATPRSAALATPRSAALAASASRRSIRPAMNSRQLSK